jgi:DNA-directed RNA polymerase subunit beta
VAGKVVKYGKKRERRNYSRINVALELPNLIEIQTSSYEWFLDQGIKEMFKDISPIEDTNGVFALEFVDYTLGEAKYSVLDSKERDVNYAAPLRVKVRLHIKNEETGLVEEVKESEIYMGDFPLMTPTGTFIINGSERVVVSQLVRSAGVYYSKDTDKKSGKVKYLAQVIPSRGAWLEYETDSKDILYVRVDRTRKMPITVLLRALGLKTREDILSVFGENPYILNTLDKDATTTPDEALMEIFGKLRQGEPATIEGARNLFASRFFDPKRYDLASVGRYKFDKKLNVIDRLLGKKIASDIFDADTGEILVEAGTVVTRDILENKLADKIETLNVRKIELDSELEGNESTYVQEFDVYAVDINGDEEIVKIVGSIGDPETKNITTSDIFATVSYFLNLLYDVGGLDDIDHLGNRRLRLVGELLQNQLRIGLSRMERVVRERMSIQEEEGITPSSLINIRPVTASIKEFFGSSQLSQFMDQTNPLSELTHKRRLSALGPGGLTRERAGMEVRDVHYSHYGRMCPIETPEGPNIGLINALSSYAKVNKYGFILTPYCRVEKATDEEGNTVVMLTGDIEYLTADEEDRYVIAQSSLEIGVGDEITGELVARFNDETLIVSPDEVDFVEVSPQQIVSVATACIPFLEHDDANRALMGANMQRQAIPLLIPEAPFVGTGMEYVNARDSGQAIVAESAGVIERVDAKSIHVRRLKDNGLDRYPLTKFQRSNSSTVLNQVPIVSMGEEIEKGQILADSSSMENGELALGRNVVVAFMTWNGYNYEDAIIMSERLVKDDVYTSIHIEEYELESRDTKLGPEEITRDIPGASGDALSNLDEYGIIKIGSEVKEDDILVGKVTAKGQAELTAEERLLHAIFGEKASEVRDTSLRVPNGGNGIVHDVKTFSREKGDELAPGVNEVVRIYIAQKRKISEGDKMAGRHGNKGVISKILPEEDMPYLPDGTPVDIMLNPLGVPSRMNIGQILEIHLGMAAKNLGIHVATPVFDGVKTSDLDEIMAEAGIDADGKTILYDGRTGAAFDNRIAVGVMYMIKLAHMVDDKLHARSIGPYSLVTQQPLGGKAQFGGQRFGEMEVWALEAYGAAYILQEVLTVKSDDINGRVKTYEAIVRGENVPEPGIPESFRVLVKELQALGMDMKILDENKEEISSRELSSYETSKIVEPENVQEKQTAAVAEIIDAETQTQEVAEID